MNVSDKQKTELESMRHSLHADQNASEMVDVGMVLTYLDWLIDVLLEGEAQ